MAVVIAVAIAVTITVAVAIVAGGVAVVLGRTNARVTHPPIYRGDWNKVH